MTSNSNNSHTSRRLRQLRKQITLCDKEILNLLAQRFKLVQEIRNFKKENSKKITDKKREKQLVDFHGSLGEKLKLNPVLVRKVFKLIIQESKKIQK